MANRRFWLGILVMALVFGMSVVGCDNGLTGNGNDHDNVIKDDQSNGNDHDNDNENDQADGDGNENDIENGQPNGKDDFDAALNGIWLMQGDNIRYKFNNGSFEISENNKPRSKGIYTTNNGFISFTKTHLHKDVYKWRFSGIDFTDAPEWKSKEDLQLLRDDYTDYEVDFDVWLDSTFGVETLEYFIVDNILTIIIRSDYQPKFERENEDHSQLPEPVGNNELNGKTYNNGFFIIEFNVDNSYILSGKRDKKEEMFIIETGFYSWNTPQKMVILKADKTDEVGTLLNESELKEFYMEYLSSFSSEELEFLSGRTIEQYVAMVVEMLFLPQTYNYVIENGEITYLGIKCTPDTGTTISGCGYSQKAATKAFGTHYLLNISFDEALVILTAAYGQPEDGWGLPSDSDLSDRDKDWVILAYNRCNDIRLHKKESGSREITTKGWLKTNSP